MAGCLGTTLKGATEAWSKTCDVPVRTLKKDFSACESHFTHTARALHRYQIAVTPQWTPLIISCLLSTTAPIVLKQIPFWHTVSAANSIYWLCMSQALGRKKCLFFLPLQQLCASSIWKTEIRITRIICYYLSPFDSGCEHIFYWNKHPRRWLVPTHTITEAERNQCATNKHWKAGSHPMFLELLHWNCHSSSMLHNASFSQKEICP